MKAAVVLEPNRIETQDVPVPEPARTMRALTEFPEMDILPPVWEPPV